MASGNNCSCIIYNSWFSSVSHFHSSEQYFLKKIRPLFSLLFINVVIQNCLVFNFCESEHWSNRELARKINPVTIQLELIPWLQRHVTHSPHFWWVHLLFLTRTDSSIDHILLLTEKYDANHFSICHDCLNSAAFRGIMILLITMHQSTCI